VNTRLALVHGRRNFERRQSVVGDFPPLQNIGQYADHFSSSGERSVGNRTHELAARTAVNQAEPRCRDRRAESRGLGAKGRIVSEGGAAKDSHAKKRLLGPDHCSFRIAAAATDRSRSRVGSFSTSHLLRAVQFHHAN
jgi:hypothetical protein